jgi:hypothetical protein
MSSMFYKCFDEFQNKISTQHKNIKEKDLLNN